MQASPGGPELTSPCCSELPEPPPPKCARSTNDRRILSCGGRVGPNSADRLFATDIAAPMPAHAPRCLWSLPSCPSTTVTSAFSLQRLSLSLLATLFCGIVASWPDSGNVGFWRPWARGGLAGFEDGCDSGATAAHQNPTSRVALCCFWYVRGQLERPYRHSDGGVDRSCRRLLLRQVQHGPRCVAEVLHNMKECAQVTSLHVRRRYVGGRPSQHECEGVRKQDSTRKHQDHVWVSAGSAPRGAQPEGARSKVRPGPMARNRAMCPKIRPSLGARADRDMIWPTSSKTGRCGDTMSCDGPLQPDVRHATKEAWRWMPRPSQQHYKRVLRIGKYLKASDMYSHEFRLNLVAG